MRMRKRDTSVSVCVCMCGETEVRLRARGHLCDSLVRWELFKNNATLSPIETRFEMNLCLHEETAV